MIKEYRFQGEIFKTERDVRKALFEANRIALGKTPNEDVAGFWRKYEIEYIEKEEAIEDLRKPKRALLKMSFLDWRNNKATLQSSLGFKVDSNERANADVDGLLVAYEANQGAKILFRDADNQFQELTYNDLKVLKKEIVLNGIFAYEQKWGFDEQIEVSQTKEELNAIEIKFVGKDFSR